MEELEVWQVILICPVCKTTFTGSIWGTQCPNCGRFVSMIDKQDTRTGLNDALQKDFEDLLKEILKETNAPSIKCPFCRKEIPPEIFAYPDIFAGTGTVVVCPYCGKSVGEWGTSEEGSYWIPYKEG